MTDNQYVSSPSFYNDETKDILISKSNTLIEAGFDLTLAEHDLITLAINKLRKQGTGSQDIFITAKEFAIANKISETNAYRQLKSTADTLMSRHLKFLLYIDLDKKQNKEPNAVCVTPPKHGRYEVVHTKHNWLQSVGYVDTSGFIYLLFSDPLKFLIDKTGDSYTNYNFTNTIEMKSSNSKRLYELVCKWKDLGKTKSMYIDEWREFFGVMDKYPNIAEFKRWVLLPSIKAINKQGEFSLTLKQEKVGRIITHFQILIKKNTLENPTKCTKTVDRFDKPKSPRELEIKALTSDKQAYSYAMKIKDKFINDDLSSGLTEMQLIEKIKKILLNPDSTNEKYQKLIFKALAETEFKDIVTR